MNITVGQFVLELHFVAHLLLWQDSPHEQSLFAEQCFMQSPVSKSHGQFPSHFKTDLEQPINGFPLKPAIQLHWTPWLITLHSAHEPQVVALSQGSIKFDIFSN